MSRMTRWRRSRPGTDSNLIVLGVGAGLLAGALAAQRPFWGAAAVASIVLIGLIVTRPVLVALIACLSVFASQRAGAGAGLPMGGNGVSYSDVMLGLATAVAAPSLLGYQHLKRLKVMLIGLGIYLACLLPAVLTDDSSRGWFEWFHRLVLVGGGAAVGYWVMVNGLALVTLRGLAALASFLAIAAMYQAFTSGFEPAYPFGLHKNFIGAQFSLVLVVLITARRVHRLGPRATTLIGLIVLGGLLASQSRGGMLAAATALLFVAAFSPRSATRQARGAILLTTLVLGGFVYFSIQAQLNQSDVSFDQSSLGIRRQVEERTLEIWRTSPVIGVGLKYFNSGEWGPLAQPPNIVVDNELAEAGIVGLAGFLVLQGTALTTGIRNRRRNPMAIVGAACLAGALVHGLVDIYWIAGSVTLPFILLGMGLADVAPKSSSEPEVAMRTRTDSVR